MTNKPPDKYQAVSFGCLLFAVFFSAYALLIAIKPPSYSILTIVTRANHALLIHRL